MRVKPNLSGVPETALWTLWYRALEARRRDRVLSDPMAVELVGRIDYPFAQRFGTPVPARAQVQALRAKAFDLEVQRFLRAHPDGTVVALGEGLETQFWRVDNGRVTWLTVDLPASARLRESLLPRGDRQLVFAGSALDPKWTELVERDNGVLITAQGLLMYLEPQQVKALISLCANRFPGGTLVFDAVGPWLARVIGSGALRFRPPPFTWTLQPSDLPSLKRLNPAIAVVREVRPPHGRGLVGWFAPSLRHLPIFGRKRPLVVALEFS